MKLITEMYIIEQVQTIGDDQMVELLQEFDPSLLPTSRRRARTSPPRWSGKVGTSFCCSPSEPIRRTIFGTTSSFFDLWSRPWGVARLLGLPPAPPSSEGVGSTTQQVHLKNTVSLIKGAVRTIWIDWPTHPAEKLCNSLFPKIRLLFSYYYSISLDFDMLSQWFCGLLIIFCKEGNSILNWLISSAWF